MLYFSTATITTVGFGDIAPISPLTRTLVALEALIGIVFIGLFVNAIAHEASESKEEGKKTADGSMQRGLVEPPQATSAQRGTSEEIRDPSQAGRAQDESERSRI